MCPLLRLGLVAVLLACPLRAFAAETVSVDVVVYGGTPAGIAAALAAGDAGRSVLLVEPYSRVGGLVTNGLTHTDFRTFEGVTGTFLRFAQRVEAYYAERYGADSPQVRQSFRGTHAEPHVNQAVFDAMLAEQPTVRVVTRHYLERVEVRETSAGTRIESAAFRDPGGARLSAKARVFIDATYEGDLMAAAGVEYRVGREARSEYGESLAPIEADGQVQGYNFRFTMTNDPQLRVMPTAPPGYRREEFLDVLPLLAAGRIQAVFVENTGGIYKAHMPRLPNSKADVNDVSHGVVRLSLPDINDAWPDGDRALRARLFAEHVRHNVGLLYFLQNDDAVPERFRNDARQWGWCRDEFVDNGHLPEQLYIREARRMVGRHVFIESDTDHAPGDARGVLHADAVAMGDYGPNCHGTAHEGPRIGGRHTGEFYKPVPPYQIPYGVLLPRQCENLLVPVACSASHVGFCALRLEPIWTALGEAAGTAAQLALAAEVPLARLPAARIQAALHRRGAATIYVSDVLPGHADFAAVQWWATAGGLHGIHPQPEQPGQRGPHVTGQYFRAYPGHAAELELPLDAPLRERWLELAAALGLKTETLRAAATRGDFIRQAFRLADAAQEAAQ